MAKVALAPFRCGMLLGFSPAINEIRPNGIYHVAHFSTDCPGMAFVTA